MAQLFKPSANNYARTSIVLGGLTPVLIGLSLAAFSRSPLNTKVGTAKNQPVPFSHTHHAWELGIDCRYCHTAVEKSSYAGLPATETCMSCHSQIWTNSPLLEPVRQSYETGTPIQWNLVNKTPEFVYFNHSIHVARGINCNNCHGPVQNMPITAKGKSFQMQWCLKCHRAPEKYLYKDETKPNQTPRQQVFDLYWKMQAKEELTPRENGILAGEEQETGDAKEIEKGKKLVNQYGVKVQQLADCWVCHR
ncbi:MAG: cytochrome c3 family protein [Armatimonadetes bacterium]|nr:cytochrome c3 family protein [Armatimonadota bacterium]